jgi:hypothetical protein
VISSVRKIIPAIEAQPIYSELLNYLRMSSNVKDSVDFNITLKDTSVYFLMQVAVFDQIGRTLDVNWWKKCSSFLNSEGKFSDTIVLKRQSGGFQRETKPITVKFSSFKRGSAASLWFEIDSISNLKLDHKPNYSGRTVKNILPFDDETIIMDKYFLFRYPYDNSRNNFRFKEVVLTMKARKELNVIKVISGATGRVCGSTFINYPESKLMFIEYPN